jgi:hypothetical protein
MEKLKKYIKENNKTKKYFFEGLKEKTISQKFAFIQNHFTYDILNSWNRLESIANNIKIYNLGLSAEQQNKFFELLGIEDDCFYENLNYIIKDFEEQTNTNIFFNGRSNGYLVIIPDFKTNNRWQNILDLFFGDNIYDYKNYMEFRKNSIDIEYMNYDYNYLKEKIEQCYYLIKAFDKLCDVLRDELIYILDNATIKEEYDNI